MHFKNISGCSLQQFVRIFVKCCKIYSKTGHLSESELLRFLRFFDGLLQTKSVKNVYITRIITTSK